jgi:hypothetical protein
MTPPLHDIHDPYVTAAIVAVPREVWSGPDVAGGPEPSRPGSAGPPDGILPVDAEFTEYIWADTTS